MVAEDRVNDIQEHINWLKMWVELNLPYCKSEPMKRLEKIESILRDGHSEENDSIL